MQIRITDAPFFASADGTHDATDALEKAFQAIATNGGGSVELPENALICISRAISLPSNIKIYSKTGKARIKYYHAKRVVSKYLFFGNQVQNVTFSNIIFDTNDQSPIVGGIVITGYGKEAMENSKIHIDNCEFSGINAKGSCAIRIQKTNDLCVENCAFHNCYIGIGLWKRNTAIQIQNNTFSDSMTNTAVRFTGNRDGKNPEFCDYATISDNIIMIQAVASVIQPNGKPKGRPPSFSGIYITCGDKNYTGRSNFHQHITVVHNKIYGPKLGFFNGGSADLFSIKDTKFLQCSYNLATGSGDLGFAFERCHESMVSYNIAEENNSCGIGVSGSFHIQLFYNKCGSNEQTRDGIYRNTPYGGMRVEYGSQHIAIENNEFYHLPQLSKPTQRYGIVVKHTFKRGKKHYPKHVQISNNTFTDQLLGTVFNEIAAM